jgi:hypothetical protein
MLRIMISHDHRETRLAGAWGAMLSEIGRGYLLPWYSSDKRPEGGVGVGQWWGILEERIRESDYLLVILTKASAARPWIIWEAGSAHGRTNIRGVIPVLFGFAATDLRGPLSVFQSFRGDNPQDAARLCRLFLRAADLELTEEALQASVQIYASAVREWCENDPIPDLFGGGFHRPDWTLDGRWDCVWYNAAGEIFERDSFDVLMEDERVRVIGHGAKGFHYPMEGRLSCLRYLCLHYWSMSHIATCGVVLMRVNPTGTKMTGEWIGHTSKDYDQDDLSMFRGKVEAFKVKPVAAAGSST